jgi:hypothetical protein
VCTYAKVEDAITLSSGSGLRPIPVLFVSSLRTMTCLLMSSDKIPAFGLTFVGSQISLVAEA